MNEDQIEKALKGIGLILANLDEPGWTYRMWTISGTLSLWVKELK